MASFATLLLEGTSAHLAARRRKGTTKAVSAFAESARAHWRRTQRSTPLNTMVPQGNRRQAYCFNLGRFKDDLAGYCRLQTYLRLLMFCSDLELT